MATVQFRKPVDDDVPWEQRLVNYASNPKLGREEYRRALEVYNAKRALGDTEGANAAQRWMNQVSTALGGKVEDDPQDQTRQLYSQVLQRLNQPRTPFQYNPQSDPLYQNALQEAQRSAQTATNNALVSLGRRGIGNSSSAVTAANQIQQNALADVNTRVLPQLMAQAYQRYLDEQNLGRQNALDLLGLGREYNTLYQQGLDNEFRNRQFAEQRKQNNLDAALRVGQQLGRVIQPKEDYGLLFTQDDAPLNLQGQQFAYQQARDQIEDERYKQKFDEDVRRFGLQYALDQARLANQIRQQDIDNAMARERLDFEKQQANKPKNRTADDYVDVVTQNFLVPEMDNLGRRTGRNVVQDPVAAERFILSLGLPDEEARKLYYLLGLKWGE